MRAVAVLVMLCLLSWSAYAEPLAPDHPLRFRAPVEIHTSTNKVWNLAPGYWLAQKQWDTLDQELKRLQESETRLKAENKVFRDEAGWSIKTIAIVLGIGFAAGAGSVLWIKR